MSSLRSFGSSPLSIGLISSSIEFLQTPTLRTGCREIFSKLVSLLVGRQSCARGLHRSHVKRLRAWELCDFDRSGRLDRVVSL